MLYRRSIPRFLQFIEFSDNVAKNTLKAYESDVRQFVSFMAHSSNRGNCTPARMLAYLSHLRKERCCSDSTVNRKLVSIRRFFNFLEEFGLVKHIRLPKTGNRSRTRIKLPQVMRLNEVKGVLLAAKRTEPLRGYTGFKGIRDQVIISLLFYTGMRVGEVVGLDTVNADLDSGAIFVHGKGGKDRILYVGNPSLLATLRQYVSLRLKTKTGCTALFINRSANRLSSRYVEMLFDACLRKAQIAERYTPHSMRHTMATTLLERGTNLRALQEILGHSSIATTQIYTHVAPRQVEEALTKLGRIRLK